MMAVVDDLRTRVAGEVFGADDPGYGAARPVWNAMIDRRPLAVVRAASPHDIPATIAVARQHRLDLAIRGGGHNVAGNGTVEGGVVLDLGQMSGVTVDAAARTVRVEAGATLADVDRATEGHGLAVPIGVVSGTGVAGLTLGGGVGWLTRAYGLAADNLLEAELVTADGETVTANAQEHPDLFWALRGGGGNFGVVTAFTFRAHPLGPQVFGGNYLYGIGRWASAWRGFAEWTQDLPDAMTAITTTLTPPPVAELGDDPLLIIGFAWAGQDRAEAQSHAARLRTLAPPDEEEVGDVRWVEWQSAFDPVFHKGVRAYWRNTSFDRLDADVIDVLVRRGEEQTWTGTGFDVHHMGGAFGRVPDDATPFPNRSAGYWLNIYGYWESPESDADNTAFVRGFSADMEPFASGGHYTNFAGLEIAGHRSLHPSEIFGASKYERLVAVKRRYDPENFFHINTNIDPA